MAGDQHLCDKVYSLKVHARTNQCKEVYSTYFHLVKEAAVEVRAGVFLCCRAWQRTMGTDVRTQEAHGPTSLENILQVGDSVVHLKRERVITPQRVWITPGDIHLKQLLELTGLNMKSTGRDTPQTKDLSTMADLFKLSPEEVTFYRRITGDLVYLPHGQPDVQFTVNELACAMSKPAKALEAPKCWPDISRRKILEISGIQPLSA